MQNLKTAGQELISEFFDTDVVTDSLKTITILIQGLTDLINPLVDTLGIIPTILGAGGIFALFKNGGVIKELGIAQNAIAGLLNMPGAIGEQEINAIANGLKNLSIQQQATVLSTTTLTNAQKVAVLEANDFTNAEISSALATSGLSAATKELTLEEFKNIAAIKAGNVAKADELTTALGLEAAENGRVIGLENITREQFIAIAMQKGYTAAQADALAMSVGYTTANGALALSFKGLTTAIAATAKAIGSTVASFAVAHPVLLAVVAAVGAIVASYVKWQKTVENANQAIEQAKKSNKENIQATEENIKTLQNAIIQYEKLGKKTKLTSDEKETLISVQNDLNKSFNTEKDGVDLVNGKYEEQLKLIKELNAEKRKELFNEKTNQYFQTTNDLNSTLTFNADDDNAHGHFGSGLIDDTIAAMLEGSKYAALYNQDVADTYAKTKRTNKESTEKVQQAIKDFEDSLNKDIEAGKNLYNVQHAQNVNPGIGDRMGMYGATFNPEATAEDILNYYKAVREYLNNNLNYEDKKDNPYYSVVSNYLDNQISAIESQLDETTKLLTERAELAFNIFGVTIGDEFVTIDNLTEENALIWKNTLVKAFAEDDPDLRKAIEDYYHYNVIPNIKRGNEEVISEGFNFSDFYEENGLEDIIKLLGKVQTAYKNIESDPNGFNLDDEVLKEFPELVNYLDDTDKLKEKLQELVNVKIEPLITSLKEMQENLPKDSDDYKAISNTISWLEKQADITTKVKEKTTKTSDLYKEQKKQIHENIQALNREISAIEKQVDALEKKKESQKEYIKLLEKEKDRLEDLIDDYETAADVVKDFLDSQLDDLEKKKDSIEDYYEEQTKAAKEYYDKQIELASEQAKAIQTKSTIYDSQIDNIEAQIKAIQDEADEQDKLNDLKEKELALEKAKSQMVRVYDATKGWVK